MVTPFQEVPGYPGTFLTVGDGDFTFSLGLMEILKKDAEHSGRTVQLTATSHESERSVLDTYKPHARSTLDTLRSLGATVLHGVDATALAETVELRREGKVERGKKRKQCDDDGSGNISYKMKRYDVVIWNFPCISLPAGADGQARELLANQQLLAKFFQNVRRCLTKGSGEVHISHKTIEPFSWWGIKQIAAENGFEFAYAIAFDK
jgi:25S rRNA (uracil2634-N3)-methyltransferase